MIEVGSIELLGRELSKEILKEEMETDNDLTFIRVYYNGSFYDNINNTLKIAVSIDKDRIGNKQKRQNNKSKDKEYLVKFNKDYRRVKSSYFDGLLNGLEYMEYSNKNILLFNKEDEYYLVIKDVLSILERIEMKGTDKLPEELSNLSRIITHVEGITYKDKSRIKTLLPIILGRGIIFGVVLLDLFDKGFSITYYKGGSNDKIKYTVNKNERKVSVDKGTYQRYPNNTSKVYERLMVRYSNQKDIINGENSRRRNMYIRNLNQINTLSKDFIVEDNANIFKNMYNEYIKVDIYKDDKRDKNIIQFDILNEDKEGIRAGEYYLDTVFNGRFYNLSLNSEEESWVVDSVVMKEIYESMLEGKY